jgi:hypothetical protein
MNPIGLPPALSRATFTNERIADAIGADTDVPAAPNRPPAAYVKKLEPATEISG